MVVEEGEMNSEVGVVESGLEQDEANKNHHSPFSASSLRTQSSIYSLTLDEFQHSLCDAGKNFGSMNMDEFLTSIWSAEENVNNQTIITTTSSNLPLSETSTMLRKQPSLSRQPSLSVPAPLCRKTVEQVWSHIQKQQHNNIQNTESAPRQPTFGEMTLEDFLVKAGVIREPCAPFQQHYENNNAAMASSFGVVAEGHTAGVCFRGGGYGVGPVSPANSSDGGAQFGLEMGGFRGRKRMGEGPVVEKVVERRQRRMIKNRESAARSRARKQAYTVELEAELNQLREENSQLKQALAEHERRRKQQCYEEVNVRVQTKAQKAKGKLRALRRNMSCPL